MPTRNQFIKELFSYLTDFIYVVFYIYKHVGIYIYLILFLSAFHLYCYWSLIHLCWKANILHLLYVLFQLWKERKVSLQSYLLWDLSSFSNPMSLHLLEQTKGKKKKKYKHTHTKENYRTAVVSLTGSSERMVQSRVDWHLSVVYYTFGNESHDSLVQNALILLDRRADKKAQISQGFRAALCRVSSCVSLPWSWESNVPGNKGTQCPPRPDCQCDQIKTLCRSRLILLDFLHLLAVKTYSKGRKWVKWKCQ